AILLLIFAVVLVTPIVIYFKLPKPINLPEDEAEKEKYYQQLAKRLNRNKHLNGLNLDLNKKEELDKALDVLQKKANETIQKTATSVFLTTAVSQNGKLDALTVLVTQTKMVWEISHIYWQRPAIRDILNLYANVGGTAFLASEVEDLDISRQIEPVLNAMFKSPGKSLPVVGHAAHIIMDSILEGSVNAFLTLRVGIITKRYCGTLEVFDRKKARSSAFIEASGLLKTLVVKSSGKVINSLIKATKRTGVNTVKSGVSALEKAAQNIKEGLGELAGKMGISKKEMEAAEKEEN
ncbi:MAG: DUF697 domain-containing protein, partial [Leptolyngbya sp. SIO1D8]|nr:DUF697 domain-containing protein [Leptolyngbya sp. SIO1D8]